MFIPHENTGHIYIVWGTWGKGLNTIKEVREEFTGSRSFRNLQWHVTEKKEKGKNWALIQYEDDRTPLGYFTCPELLAMGVLRNLTYTKGGTPKKKDRTMGDFGIGKIPARPKVKTPSSVQVP
jgi:hypothetical protein